MSQPSQAAGRPVAAGEDAADVLVVFVVGDVGVAGLREVHGGLARLAGARRIELRAARWLPEALAAIRSGLFPDLIVLAQARPGQFADDRLDALRRAAPAAGVVAVVGTWCEGEGRSARPWPGALRWTWHQAATRLPAEIERMVAGACPSWGLPPTATAEDELLQRIDSTAPDGPVLQRAAHAVAIASGSRGMEDTLARAIRVLGLTAVRVRMDEAAPAAAGTGARLPGLAAAIWDGADGQAEEREQLTKFIAVVRPAPVIALLSFPRAETMQRLANLGVAAVLAKPFLLSDLEGALARCIDSGARDSH